MSKKKDKTSPQMIKTIYFDEEAAQDYLDIKNGGRFDWSTDENKEKISKIICEIDAKASCGFNILSLIKATLEGNADIERDATLSRIVDSTLKNTLRWLLIRLHQENVINSLKNIKQSRGRVYHDLRRSSKGSLEDCSKG